MLSVKRVLRRSFLLLPLLLALTSAVSLLGGYPLKGLAASFDARADYTAWLKRHPYWSDEHPGCVGEMIYEMPIGKSPSRGPANAKVTLVEFVDFNDSYSRQLALACESFLKRHPGQFRLVFKNFPNSHNQHSLEQHRVAMAALLQGKFWPMYERLFVQVDDGQRDENTYLRWAKQLHLDLDKFQRDRKICGCRCFDCIRHQ